MAAKVDSYKGYLSKRGNTTTTTATHIHTHVEKENKKKRKEKLYKAHYKDILKC